MAASGGMNASSTAKKEQIACMQPQAKCVPTALLWLIESAVFPTRPVQTSEQTDVVRR
jgi:hypothetical protein